MPEPSGSEGMADVQIIAALHRSIEGQGPVLVDSLDDRRHPTVKQRIDRPPVRKRSTVNSRGPRGG